MGNLEAIVKRLTSSFGQYFVYFYGIPTFLIDKQKFGYIL